MSNMNFAKRKPDKKFWALVKERDLLEKERDTLNTLVNALNVKIQKLQDDIDKTFKKMDFEEEK